jgi:hypothetical protein
MHRLSTLLQAPDTAPQAPAAPALPAGAERLISLMGVVFSTVVLSGINIAVSGQLLGYLFNLGKDGSDHFTMKIPSMLEIKLRGAQVAAGFAAFTVSLLLVGIFLSTAAHRIFVVQLGATENRWIASQALATSLSVTVCLLLGGVKTMVIVGRAYYLRQSVPVPSDTERVARLIEEP